MGRYWVLQAVAFMNNGEPLFYRTIPKEPVEINDEVAASLGDKVRPVTPPVEDRPDGIEGDTGDPLDGIVETVEELNEVEDVPAPKPKRKRKVEEEESDGDTQV